MNKSILYVDDRLPEYDKAAGARSSYMYVKLLRDMGYTVTFFPADLVRREPYASKMEELGVAIRAGRLFRLWWRIWLRFNASRFEVVFFNRPDFTHPKLRYFKNCYKTKKIYQCHDLHHLRMQRQYEVTNDQRLFAELRQMETIEREVYGNIDVALTFSEYEKKIIEKKYAPPRTVVVPLYFYEKTAASRRDSRTSRNLLYIGGFNHRPNVDAVQWFVGEVLPLVRRHLPDVVLLVAGSSPPPEISALDGHGVKVLGYVDDRQMAELYQSVRIVVVPLRYGAGVKGKVIEAIHNRVPLVSTSIGLEGIEGIEAILKAADTAADFSSAVVELYQNEDKLAAISEALGLYAAEHLDVAAARALMQKVIEG